MTKCCGTWWFEGRFGYEDVTGMHWTEVDFPGDIEIALHSESAAVHREQLASEGL
jgi:hypothetical protein